MSQPERSETVAAETPARLGIVVGLDGTPDASAALRWAVAHTDLFGPIQPVLSWHYPAYVWLPQPLGTGAPPAATMQAAAESAARACVEQVDPDLIGDPVVVEGDPGPVLVERAASSSLLVVGARGLGPVRSWMLGSVGRYCADHTKVPLVIVPQPDHEPGAEPVEWGSGPRRIAVGIDGSAHSEDALRWALRYSRADDVITAHATWHYLGGLGYETYAIEAPVLEEAARETLARTVARVTKVVGIEEARVQQVVDNGDPRVVLREVGASVDLLVVGQRGHTGLPHLLLGSTTTSLVHRPVGPIAVIPPEGPEPG